MARPHGSKNTKTKDWESFGKEMIEGGLPRLNQILENCDDETFLKTYIQLLEFFKPKMKRIEQTGTVQETVVRVIRE